MQNANTTLKQGNNSKMWNSKASTRFRTKAVRDHFNKTKDVKTMHGGTIDEQIGVTLKATDESML